MTLPLSVLGESHAWLVVGDFAPTAFRLAPACRIVSVALEVGLDFRGPPCRPGPAVAVLLTVPDEARCFPFTVRQLCLNRRTNRAVNLGAVVLAHCLLRSFRLSFRRQQNR